MNTCTKATITSVATLTLAVLFSGAVNAEPTQKVAKDRTGFEIAARIGVNDMGGHADDHYGMGGHVAVTLGGRLNKMFSLHAELSVDVLNYNWADQFQAYTGGLASASVVPYFHFGSGRAKLIVGPKIGVFIDEVSAEPYDGGKIRGESVGLVWGGNAALMFRVGSGHTHIGPIFTWQSYSYSEFCETTGGRKTCTPVPDDYKQSLVNLSLAVWY